PVICGDVVLDHAIRREPLQRHPSALFRIERLARPYRIREIISISYENSRFPVLHHFRQRSVCKRHYRRAAGQRFPGNQGAGFWGKTRHDETTRGREQTTLSSHCHWTDVSPLRVEFRHNFFRKVGLMFTKRIYLAGEQHGCVRLSTRSQCKVESLLRTNPPQCGRELAFAGAPTAEQ